LPVNGNDGILTYFQGGLVAIFQHLSAIVLVSKDLDVPVTKLKFLTGLRWQLPMLPLAAKRQHCRQHAFQAQL